jgi:uncharacterized Ntn-hydrolase superfamily protein
MPGVACLLLGLLVVFSVVARCPRRRTFNIGVQSFAAAAGAAMTHIMSEGSICR